MERVITLFGYEAPCSRLLLGACDDALCLCAWEHGRGLERVMSRVARGLDAVYVNGCCDVIRLAVKQLDEYFDGSRTSFDIPLLHVGTDFQRMVWSGLLSIPYGHTVAYGELAGRLGVRNSVRAVANANGANALSIFVPCHRVIGSDGSLTGYAGGVPVKEFLLRLEQRAI